MAVMDCHEQIHKTLGENKYGRIVVEADMTADYDHFSYEMQGSVRINSLLMITYLALVIAGCYDRLKFEDNFAVFHSPHYYCTIACALQAFGIFC